MELLVTLTCAYGTLQKLFAKTFCHDKNVDVLDYAPARNVLAVYFFRIGNVCRSELATFGKVVDRVIKLSAISWIRLLQQQLNAVFLVNT